MKRAKESGAHCWNKKKAKEENIRNNEGSIIEVCESFGNDRVKPATPESTPGPSGSGNYLKPRISSNRTKHQRLATFD